jgi:hypothetical protein
VKTGRILAGVRVDGVAFYAEVTLADGEEICRQCEGTGKLTFNAAYDGFERIETCECPNCEGEGHVYAGTDDDDDGDHDT